jgi:hypothetical protein
MIGGGGEKKTLRLVAHYGDACNVPGYDIGSVEHKLAVLRQHCETEGRNYDDILKTAIYVTNVGPNGEQVGQVVEHLGRLAGAGVQKVVGALVGVENIKPIEIVGRDVIPQVARM